MFPIPYFGDLESLLVPVEGDWTMARKQKPPSKPNKASAPDPEQPSVL
jgi:hypothetical protein